MQINNLVLIIDDEPGIRCSASGFLEDNGYRCIQAANGEEGLFLISIEPPDVVIADLRMPVMDGLTFLDRMSVNYSAIPVIIMSGAGKIDDVVNAMQLGAWDYVRKPLEEMSLLLYSVKRALAKVNLMNEAILYRETLEKQVKDKTRQLQLVNHKLHQVIETAIKLTGANSIDHLGHQVLEDFGRHMLATGGSLYLKTKKGLKLTHTLDPGHAPDFIPYPLRDGSPFSVVLKTGKPLVINDLSGVPGISTVSGKYYKDGSLFVLPIPDATGEILGLMSLHNRIGPPFIDEDKEIGTLLAVFCAEGIKAVNAIEKLKNREDALEHSLNEKIVLLQEVHHRVKNNLQVILSLLNLQRDRMESEKDKELFTQSINRIYSMALAHERIYAMDSPSRIQMESYFSDIAETIKGSMEELKDRIGIRISSHGLCLDIGTAVLCGLILNELVTNSLKYAFPAGRRGSIDITAEMAFGNNIRLTIEDDGVGIENMDEKDILELLLNREGPLGLKIAANLVKQMSGTMEISHRCGVCCTIIFPVEPN